MPAVINLILTYKYYILLPFAVVEGPIVMMVSGLLVKLGYLNFLFAYILLMIGDLVGDIGWYGVGYLFGMSFVRRFGKFFNITEEGVVKVENIFSKHDSKILLISKMTMGLGFALVTLVASGLVKTPFKRFVFWNVVGGLFWTGFLMMVGFYLGNFYLKFNSILGKAGVLSLIVVVFIALIGVARYVRNRLTKV